MEGAITAVPGDAMEMDVSDDAGVRNLLEEEAAGPNDRGSDVGNACGGLEVFPNALGWGAFNTTVARPESSAVGALTPVLPVTADCCVRMSVWCLSGHTAIARSESNAVRGRASGENRDCVFTCWPTSASECRL